MNHALALLIRLLLATAYATSALWMLTEALPAATAAYLQQENPPFTLHRLTEEQSAELREQMSSATKEDTPRLVFREVTPELGELLQAAGLSPDVSGFITLMSAPINTGDARRDLLQATLRSGLTPPHSWCRFCASADGNLAVFFFRNKKQTTDVYENTPEGIKSTLLLLTPEAAEPQSEQASGR